MSTSKADLEALEADTLARARFGISSPICWSAPPPHPLTYSLSNIITMPRLSSFISTVAQQSLGVPFPAPLDEHFVVAAQDLLSVATLEGFAARALHSDPPILIDDDPEQPT